MHQMRCSLLKNRFFLPLFLAQFFGAFNDNAFKLAMLTLISYHLTSTQALSEHYQALAGGLFILPFFIFSATAGQLADKFDKAMMARIVKAFEVLLMIIGGFGLYYGQTWLLLVTLTGMGIHSALFGPLKYAILPEHLQRTDLLSATALIEASTFLAILLGTTLGTLSIGSTTPHTHIAIFLTLLSAMIGLIASLYIPNAPSKAHDLVIDWRIWRATLAMVYDVYRDKLILPAIFAISWFWLLGGVMLTKLPDYIHYVLSANALVFAYFLSLFSIGIATGSMMISRLLDGRITLRYVPYCMLALSFFAYDLFKISPEPSDANHLMGLITFLWSGLHLRIAFDFFMFSFCSGLFTVPLYAYLQVCGDETSRARTIAANNIWNALFMVFGALFVMLLLYFKVSISHLFLLLALLNAIATIVMSTMLFRQSKRLIVW
jgi:MFS family permease